MARCIDIPATSVTRRIILSVGLYWNENTFGPSMAVMVSEGVEEGNPWGLIIASTRRADNGRRIYKARNGF